MMRTTLSLLAILTAAGCADQLSADGAAGGGAGGKADDATSISGPMEKVDETTQGYLRAADAECLHVHYTHDETYAQAVKLICLPRGASVAPIALYVAVTPLGEQDGAYEVFEVPMFVSDVPAAVTFRMSGNQATITATVKQPSIETEDLVFVDHTLTTTVTFTGEGWQPTVTGTYSIQ